MAFEQGNHDRDSEFFPQTSLRDLTFILFKRKWSVVTIILVTMFSAVIWLWFIRGEAYDLTAEVLVKIGQEQAPPATVIGQPAPEIGQRIQDVNSEIDILQSTELLGQLVDKLHLDHPSPPPVPEKFIPLVRYRIKALVQRANEWKDEVLITVGLRERLAPREAAIFFLRQGLVAKPQRDSNVIVVSLLVPMRHGSSIILNTLLDLYQNFRLKVYADHSAVAFFNGQVDDSWKTLRDAEEELQQFEESGKITEIEKQQEVLLGQIARAQSDLRDADIARLESLSKVDRLDKEMEKPDPNFGVLGDFDKDSFPQTMLTQLAELQKERERLRMTELDAGDRIQNNRKQFNALLALLGANLSSALAEKQEIYQTRKEAFDGLQAQLDSIHGRQMRLSDLKRRVKVGEDAYLFYRKKIEEASATTALEQQHIGSVAVIEPAIDPVQASGPRKTLLLGLSGLMAVVAALVWVVMAEFFDHRVYTGEELQKHLGAPVIGVIPAGKPLMSNLSERKHAMAIGAYAEDD